MRAIVTGASFGLGEAFAAGLAARGVDLLLVARTDARLLPMAADLGAAHSIRAEIVTLDLVDEDAPRQLQAQADRLGFEPDVLVHAAHIDVAGPFAEIPFERIADSVRLGVEGLVALTHLYLPRMVARKQGAIVNVASSGAFAPLPGHAVRAASDAFILSLGAALWAEQRRNGVRVVTVCPGGVEGGARGVDSDEAGGRDRLRGDVASEHTRRSEGGRARFGSQESREAVVASTLAAVERGDPVVLPGRGLGVVSGALGMLPPRSRVQAAAWLARRYPNLLLGTRRGER